MIAESLSQHDEEHVVPALFSGTRVGKRNIIWIFTVTHFISVGMFYIVKLFDDRFGPIDWMFVYYAEVAGSIPAQRCMLGGFYLYLDKFTHFLLAF
jgi:hypothetical protein